jgi:hypothetical protein
MQRLASARWLLGTLERYKEFRAMDEKAQALKGWLEKAFPGSVIEYRFPLTLHKFRINTEKTAYWLYISREFVDDNEVDQVIHAAERAKVLEAFRASDKPRWIFLGSNGAKEVDENFGRDA